MPLPSSSIRHCHPHCFKTPFARCNGLKYSFVLSAVHLWNNLPLDAVSSADLRAFKFYVSPLFLYSKFLLLISLPYSLGHFCISYISAI